MKMNWQGFKAPVSAAVWHLNYSEKFMIFISATACAVDDPRVPPMFLLLLLTQKTSDGLPEKNGSNVLICPKQKISPNSFVPNAVPLFPVSTGMATSSASQQEPLSKAPRLNPREIFTGNPKLNGTNKVWMLRGMRNMIKNAFLELEIKASETPFC